MEKRLQQLEESSWRTIHFSHPDYNAIGAGIAIFASAISALGTNTQRRSHMINDALPEDQQVHSIHHTLLLFCAQGVSSYEVFL